MTLDQSEKNRLFEDIGFIKGKLESLPCEAHANHIDDLTEGLSNHKVDSSSRFYTNIFGLITKGLTFLNAIAIIGISLLIYTNQ